MATATTTKKADTKSESESPQLPKHGSLAAALCAVMSDVGTVAMSGKLPVGGGRRVSVLSVGDLAKALQPALAQHGVIIAPGKMQVQTTLVGQTKNGVDQYRTDLVVEWVVNHRDSDDVMSVSSAGAGTDTGDKGIYKAQTGALKYLYRLLL